MMDYMEQKLSKRLEPSSILGPMRTKKSSYFKSIQPAKVLKDEFKKQLNSDKPSKVHPKDIQRSKKAADHVDKRDKMVNTYRDRLLPRYTVA